MNNLLQKFIPYIFMFAGAMVQAQPPYVPPLAADAKTAPDKFPEEIKAEKERMERVRYSVLIGSRAFDNLEAEANALIEQYRDKKISADEWIGRFLLMVPLKSGKGQIDDLIAWGKAKPKSYAAKYVLGRQYLELAMSARGDKWARETSPEEFGEMEKYGQMANQVLLQSLQLNAKPLPSYRALISVDNFAHEGLAKTQLEYLTMAIKDDPNALTVYRTFFNYNSPRWGGSYELLNGLIEQAQRGGAMSKQNVAELKGEVLAQHAADAADLRNNPALSAELYVKAFDASPTPEHIDWLYWAAAKAKRAHDVDRAFAIYDKIIATRDGEYRAYFERGVLFRAERKEPQRDFADQIAAAKLGYMYAQNNVGYFYLTGDNGFPIDLQQAKAWLTLAASQGYQHAKDKLPVVEAKLAQEAAVKNHQ